jgi:hypothetical protein
MKTRAVKIIEGSTIVAPDVGAAIFLLIVMFGYSDMLSDTIGYVTIFFVVLPLVVLWNITEVMMLNFETLPAKSLIIDKKTDLVIQKPLNQSLLFLPFIDKYLMRRGHEKLLRLDFDGCGELMNNPTWLNTQLSLFGERVRSRANPYKPRMYMRELKKFLKFKFRKDFDREPIVSLINFDI